MRLTELFPGKTNIENISQTKQYARTAADVGRQLHSLVPGQTIRGEIVGRNGNEVQIRLSEDMVLNARIDQSINLEMGKNLTFEVKNNGVTLTLSPLFTNVSADMNVLKALDMAGLPVNETTVSMTEQLMEAGLPINRATLQQVYREINSFPEGEVSDVINLHKLQMPVNESNMSQMAAYRNLTYQLTSAMDTVLELMPQALDGMVEEGNITAATDMYRELFAMILDGKASSAFPEGVLPDAAGLPADVPDSQNIVPGMEPEVLANPEAEQNPEAQAMKGSVIAEQMDAVTGMPVVSEGAVLPDSARQEIAEQFSEILDELPVTPEEKQDFLEQIRTFAQDGTDVRQLFALSEKMLRTAGDAGRQMTMLKELFGQRNFRELLTEQLKNLWTIRPEEVENPEKIGELYRRLERQLSSLTRALESGGQAESGAYKAASTISQNIDFLQQLNQMYAYVQLPLHLQEGNAHGDFYVYANRRGLASPDGKVSALLHLDMEHLGPLDVYVTLQDAKVNTKFSLKDEEMLDFLGEHMEILTKRLKKRGYDCSYSMTTRETGEEQAQDKGLKPILEQEKGILLSMHAFDVRT